MVSLEQAKQIWLREIANTDLAENEPAADPAIWTIAIVLCLSIVLLPLGAPMLHKLILRRRRMREHEDWLEEMAQFIYGAQPTWAYPVMLNEMLRSPGVEAAPGLFLVSISTEGHPALPSARMMDLIASAPPALDAMLADEQYVPHRRRRLFEGVPDAAKVFACDLMIHPRTLIGDHISDEMPFVPCLVEPGETGRIAVIPWWFLNGEPSTSDAERKMAMREVEMAFLTPEILAASRRHAA